MKIKFESENRELLHEFHQYLYERNKSLIVDEHYEMTPGVHKEPMVVALIIALGGKHILEFIQKSMKDFLDYKIERSKQETLRQQEQLRHKEVLLKLSLYENGKWQDLTSEAFEKLETRPEKENR
ncbi:hypothetical protein [Mucilaginibacter aquatilis]|uniref:Uncharacterized protein n=1 Tax=Mucilaginibacter aquatilis TaxID=1517760 RepID=A0A6I4ID05_9SPHI|nr:hypothetical protein [Mucilaginibacter aquatilis]MVN91476.1 hypothetical protein [Mucilaginibacter aquatilis]